jgi:lysophospholipase L1-like esterase
LPAQIDAVTPDTSLVTITIGGNDVEYVGGLMWAACGGAPATARDPRCKEVLPASDASWQSLGSALRKIVAKTRARAPNARIILVDYLAVLPPEGTCSDIVMSTDRAEASRAVAARLATHTAQVAREAHIDVLRASELSAAHSACAADAWTSGFPHPGGPKVVVPYHPTLAGMTAVAKSLEVRLSQ